MKENQIILNRSFNFAGEPIVETPEDAIRCFLFTNIDGLLIGELFYEKKDVSDGSASGKQAGA